MLQPLLKQATAQQHTELEHLMFVEKIMAKTLRLDEYSQLLAVNYTVHHQLENKIANYLSDEMKIKINFEARLKTDSLRKDLIELGLNVEAMDASFSHLADYIDLPAKAIGALYVLEGSSIGGQVIYKKMVMNSNIPSHLSYFFYRHYGEQTILMWKDFVNALNQLPASDFEYAVGAAVDTFKALKKVAKNWQPSKPIVP